MARRNYKAARRRARAALEPVEFDFSWDENVAPEGEPEQWEEHTETFQCFGQVSTLVLSELAYNSDVEVATEEGMALIRQVFAQAFGSDAKAQADYRRFFRLVTLHGDDEVLMEIMQGLIEDLMGRPTQESSDSSSTPSTSGVTSKVVSFSRGTVEMVPEGSFEVEPLPELPTEGEDPEQVWGSLG